MGDVYCVYAHINKTNNKTYIGITKQFVDKRWRNGGGYRSQEYFYRAIKKYSWGGFYHEIIASSLTKEEAQNFEKILIRQLKTNDNNFGYNVTDGGEGVSGLKLSDEQKEHLSNINKGKWTGANNGMYGIKMIDKIGEEKYNLWLDAHKEGRKREKHNLATKIICLNTKEIFECIKDASEKYNIVDSDISACCSKNKNVKSAGKHPETKLPMVWMYYKNYLENPIDYFYENKMTRKIFCYTTGEYFNSTQEASVKYNINHSAIWKCCAEQRTFGGEHPHTKEKMEWCYIENQKLKDKRRIL